MVLFVHNVMLITQRLCSQHIKDATGNVDICNDVIGATHNVDINIDVKDGTDDMDRNNDVSDTVNMNKSNDADTCKYTKCETKQKQNHSKERHIQVIADQNSSKKMVI